MKEWWEDDKELDRALQAMDKLPTAPVASTPEAILSKAKLTTEGAFAAGVGSSGTLITGITAALLVGFGGGWFAHQNLSSSGDEPSEMTVPEVPENKQESEPAPRVEPQAVEEVKEPKEIQDTPVLQTLPPILTTVDPPQKEVSSQAQAPRRTASSSRKSQQHEELRIDSHSEEILSLPLAPQDERPPQEESSSVEDLPSAELGLEERKEEKREEQTAAKTKPQKIKAPKNNNPIAAQSRDLRIYATVGARKNAGIKNISGYAGIGVRQSSDTEIATEFGVQLELNSTPHPKNPVVPSISGFAAIGKNHALGRTSVGVVGGIRPQVLRFEGDEERKHHLFLVPVAGVQLGHEWNEEWFADIQLEGAVLRPEHDADIADDIGKPSPVWLGIQVGKIF